MGNVETWNRLRIAPKKFCLCNQEPWVLETGSKLKESGIPLTIRIRNPGSFDKDPESSTLDQESKTVLDFLTWGALKEIGFLMILLYDRRRNMF